MNKWLVSACLMAGMMSSGIASANEALAQSKNCLACHAVDKQVVGPSLKAIGAKYAGQAGADAQLAQKIIKGSSGVWGGAPMPPNSVSEADATTLAHWILGLK
ncbi:MAG: c-type cytochrome [Methylococcaceae bacterium]|nr:MAG: c-type cytochrome [Methylococcaceae bacterium]